MKLEFLGADHEVTGSCHYLQVGELHILVDCGMEQGPDLYVNQEIPVNAAQIDYILITHAHIDHSGLLPLLYSHGFRGKIYATNATAELCDIMLKDSAHIQQFEAEWKNRKARRAGKEDVIPLYDMNDAVGVLDHFVPCPYEKEIEIHKQLTIRFVDAGHLLGSASIEVWAKEEEGSKKIVFSGDLGNGNKPLIKDPHFIEEADYVVMESTYGDRFHEENIDYARKLAEVIAETFKRGGNVVIPAFSVGRTQEMLYFLRRVKTENLVPEYPDFEVYIDSPLAVEATGIFHKNVTECFDEEALALVNHGINPIRFDGLKMAITSGESKMINFDEKSKVIISASGMCEAGRIRHHLKHNLWRKDSTIVFVGFQVLGTLGNFLLNGGKVVKLFGEQIDVQAKILNLPGLSGHADKKKLLEWVGAFQKPPKRVFVVHGDDEVCDSFAKCLQQDLNLDAVAPYSGDVFDLLTNTQIQAGSREIVERKEKKRKAASGVFARLLAMGERLMAVIRKNEGGANKDLAKFADQISALCDKWDK
ncbi:MAG: MBL fold metallo-hydrolase [Lachnospiraceae bacterium]|nr:MBL fold metallo-hydrolase [Lachnospiraceae bacterium]